ncbi:hypothetical protein [Methylophilus sp. Leaf408]|uniref:hypothetical protein n=1 Tax=Methylophilus sp. Leaf408 TaxID=2876561 RepID=UPI001E2863F4|nr:hypothetical protein [Methylophilus sp. Leaf408]
MQDFTKDDVKSNDATFVNTSGMGKDAVIPEGVKGWSWGHCDYLTDLSGKESFGDTLPVFQARRIISWLPVIQVKSAFCISSDQAKWC